MSDNTEDDEEESGDDSQTSDGGANEKNIQTKSTRALKRRVSFKEDKENDVSEEKLAEDRFIQIEFKHSDSPSIAHSTDDSTITSPADIYLNYLKGRTPKSILKQSSSLQYPLSEEFNSTQYPFTKPVVEEVPTWMTAAESDVKAVGEVVERTVETPAVSETKRPVSRFKAARMANKR